MRHVIALAFWSLALPAGSAEIRCCDVAPLPYTSEALQPDAFSLVFDGKAPISAVPFVAPDGSKQLRFNLTPLNLTNGSHTLAVTAIKNATDSSTGGSSPAANFTFTVGAPVAPSNVRIQ